VWNARISGSKSSWLIQEEERRAFYVGMTRARMTLAILDSSTTGASLVDALEGPWILKRRVASSRVKAGPPAVDYLLFGLEDIYLGYAGQFVRDHPVHAALACLEPGDRLTLDKDGSGIGLFDLNGTKLTRLSRKAAADWESRPGKVREVRMVAMIRWRAAQDEDAARRQRYCVDAWEVPVIEVVSEAQPGSPDPMHSTGRF
jgi:ATP-dependent DNA helicase RecQ